MNECQKGTVQKWRGAFFLSKCENSHFLYAAKLLPFR